MAKNEILMLDPAEVVADDNSRYGLRQSAIDGLKASIMAVGEVQSPVGVELLPKDKAKGKAKYRLVFGFGRHRSVTELNKEGAGLKLPAQVVDVADESARLLRQVAENVARQDLSPMDKAVAMKRLLDNGTPRQSIREMFSTSIGKRREPMSNASLNIHLRMLDLPKAIQEDIHAGVVGVAAAYELGKVSPEKRAAVLERAKADVAKQQDIEAKDEAKFLNAIKRVDEAKASVEEKKKAIGAAESEVETSKQTLAAKKAAYEETKKAFKIDDLKEKGQKAMEPIKAAEADVKSAEKLVKKAEAAVKRAKDEAEKAEAVATGQEKKLAEKKAKKKGAKAVSKKVVGPGDVKKAAKAEGESGEVALNAADMRQGLKDIIKQASKNEWTNTATVAELVLSCFNGKNTPKMTCEAIAETLKEKKVGR